MFHLYRFHTYTHGCCGSRRMLYPARSARDPYCMRRLRTVSVLCLWISDPIRSPILKVISCFTYAADKVSQYWLCILSPYSLRQHTYSVRGVSTLSADHRKDQSGRPRRKVRSMLLRHSHRYLLLLKSTVLRKKTMYRSMCTFLEQ